MRVAVAVTEDAARVSGHAGQARYWLLYELAAEGAPPPPRAIVLTKEQLPHHFQDDGPHPLHGVQLVVAGSAGDGFVRHMAKWGAEVLLTGEGDPQAVLQKIRAGAQLADPRFDLTTALCRLRDLFSRH